MNFERPRVGLRRQRKTLIQEGYYEIRISKYRSHFPIKKYESQRDGKTENSNFELRSIKADRF